VGVFAVRPSANPLIRIRPLGLTSFSNLGFCQSHKGPFVRRVVALGATNHLQRRFRSLFLCSSRDRPLLICQAARRAAQSGLSLQQAGGMQTVYIVRSAFQAAGRQGLSSSRVASRFTPLSYSVSVLGARREPLRSGCPHDCPSCNTRYTGAVKLLLASLACVALYAQPKQYDCHRATSSLKIDGRLDDAAWKTAAWTDAFIDIVGEDHPKPGFRRA